MATIRDMCSMNEEPSGCVRSEHAPASEIKVLLSTQLPNGRERVAHEHRVMGVEIPAHGRTRIVQWPARDSPLYSGWISLHGIQVSLSEMRNILYVLGVCFSLEIP